jgi:ribosomal protein S20
VEAKKTEHKDIVKEESVKLVEKVEEAVVPNVKSISLEDFETAVKKLKSMFDSGVISKNEFAVEKKKLFKLLY